MFFWLDFDKISFNLVKYASVTRQLAILAASIAFYDIPARACAEIKILRSLLEEKVTYVLRLFDF